MKKNVFLTVLILILLLGISCSKSPSQSTPKNTEIQSTPAELHIYNWADYVNPDVIAHFEKKFNCKIIQDFFDSNEAMYAKIKAGATGYDLYICTSYMIKLLKEQKMIQPLNHNKIPNIVNLDPAYMQLALDRKMEYSIPYLITFSGIAYNKEKVKNFKPSWTMFDRVDLKGRMTIMNDYREAIGSAMKTLGKSYNTADAESLAEAKKIVIRWKKNIAKFDVDEAKRGLTAGEFYLIHAYNGDALQFMKENANLAFATPEEGTSMSCDEMVIPVTAKNAALAHDFINFMLDAQNSAENMKFVNYLAPNIPAQKLMPKEFLENPAVYPNPEILKKSDMLQDLGTSNQAYTKVWDEIKEAK